MEKKEIKSAELVDKFKILCNQRAFKEAYDLIESSWESKQIEEDMLYFLTGYLSSSLGNLVEAKKYYSKAIAVNDHEGLYYFERALMNYGIRLLNEAKEDCISYSELGYRDREASYESTEEAKDKGNDYIIGTAFDLALEMNGVYTTLNTNEIKNDNEYKCRIIDGLFHSLYIAEKYNLTIIICGEILAGLLETLKLVIKHPALFFNYKYESQLRYLTQLKEIKIFESVELKYKLDPNKKYLWFTTYTEIFDETLDYYSEQKNIVLWCLFNIKWESGKIKGKAYLTKPFERNYHRPMIGDVDKMKKYNRFIKKEINKC